jgi:hypothetical protein
MVGYVGYTDRFAGTLTGVRQHLDYLTELGVTYLHLMPLLPPRDGENDGGYAVADAGHFPGSFARAAGTPARALHDRRADGQRGPDRAARVGLRLDRR